MQRHALGVFFLSLVMACSTGGRLDPDDPMGGGEDLAAGGGDGGGGDGGGGDGGGGDGGSQGTGLPCTPGTHRCGAGSSVEICNSSGTAWLHAQTCAVSCAGGLCSGACAPRERRCNMNVVEECNADGTGWGAAERCATFCAAGQCALAGLEITMNRNLDGEVIVAGDVVVRSGATLSSPRGDLTLRARSITVENGATIAASPAGMTPDGRGGTSSSYSFAGGGGGGYGTSGSGDASGYAPGGLSFGSDRDATVVPGSPGGSNIRADSGGGKGGDGGGVLRLIADRDIAIAGFVTANGAAGGNATSSSYGGGGGGAGGGILLGAGGDITVSGTLSAQGGMGGTGNYRGGKGGDGRVKILSGGRRQVTGMVFGVRTEGLLPPLQVTSSSHPNPDLVYNDDFPSLDLAWTRPFPSRQGYYHLVSQTAVQVPTPATGAFVNTEMVSLLPGALRQGTNYFHIVPVDSMSNVGSIEGSLRIRINSSPPSVQSMSHPNPSNWSMNRDVFFQWSFPVEDRNLKGAYYVLDRFGSTVPTKAATFVPVGQKQLLRSGLDPGVWVMHVISVDQRDYLTKAAGHYRVNIGEDPGTGNVLGQVIDMTGKPVPGASVTVNRGLYTQTTNDTGNYNVNGVPAGTWELRVTKTGFMAATKMFDVAKGGSTTVNVTLN